MQEQGVMLAEVLVDNILVAKIESDNVQRQYVVDAEVVEQTETERDKVFETICNKYIRSENDIDFFELAADGLIFPRTLLQMQRYFEEFRNPENWQHKVDMKNGRGSIYSVFSEPYVPTILIDFKVYRVFIYVYFKRHMKSLRVGCRGFGGSLCWRVRDLDTRVVYSEDDCRCCKQLYFTFKN
jgi:hypothetical protein